MVKLICSQLNVLYNISWLVCMCFSRIRQGEVGLQLGFHQKYQYYISQCKEKQIDHTVAGDGVKSIQERAKLIENITKLLNDIMRVFMPAAKKPVLFISCPLCSTYLKNCVNVILYIAHYLVMIYSVLATWLCTTVTLVSCTLTGEVS